MKVLHGRLTAVTVSERYEGGGKAGPKTLRDRHLLPNNVLMTDRFACLKPSSYREAKVIERGRERGSLG